MYISSSSRKELLELLGSKGQGRFFSNAYFSADFPVLSPKAEEMYLLWENDPYVDIDLPSAIVLNDNEVKDFFAWSSTFISNYRPFSAYIRVIPFTSLSSYFSLQIKPSLGALANASAGVIIAETLSSFPEKMSKQALTPLLCASSYSYCIARTLALGLPFVELYKVSTKLSIARNLTSQPPRRLNHSHINLMWYVIYNLMPQNGQYKNQVLKNKPLNLIMEGLNDSNIVKYYLEYIVEACREFIGDNIISSTLINKFTDYKLNTNHLLHEMNETLERRVISFNIVVNSVEFRGIDNNLIQSFLIGYFANLLNPGSFAYIDLVMQQLPKYPMALLWYGLFAGLSRNNDVITAFDGLGRRIVRDICAPSNIFDQPTSDISLEELEVFFTGDNKLVNFRRGSPNHLEIELSPCIKTASRLSDSDKYAQQSTTVDYSKIETPEELFETLEKHIKIIDDIRSKLKLTFYSQANRADGRKSNKATTNKKSSKDTKQSNLL